MPSSLLTTLARGLCLIALATLGGFLGQQLTQPSAQAQAAPAKRATRVAVANIRKLFVKAERTKEAEKQLKAKLTAQEKVLNAKLEQLEAEKKELRTGKWDQTNPIFRGKLKDLAQRYEVLKGQIEWERVRFKREMRQLSETLYNAIVAEVEAYAKAEGYDLVLKIDDIPEESPSDRALANKINRRHVLYHAAAVDITAQVLARLNR